MRCIPRPFFPNRDLNVDGSGSFSVRRPGENEAFEKKVQYAGNYLLRGCATYLILKVCFVGEILWRTLALNVVVLTILGYIPGYTMNMVVLTILV